MKQGTSIFSNITKQQNSEFGLVAILITAILAYWLEDKGFLLAVIILTFVVILIPKIFTPFTAIWNKFSRMLGKVVSSILLGLIFFFVVTPVGYVRRLCKKDSLLLKQFKKSNRSVFVYRDHTYTKDDMIHMF